MQEKVVLVVALDPLGVIGGQHLTVGQRDAAWVAAVLLEIDNAERFAPRCSLIIAETDVNTFGLLPVAVR